MNLIDVNVIEHCPDYRAILSGGLSSRFIIAQYDDKNELYNEQYENDTQSALNTYEQFIENLEIEDFQEQYDDVLENVKNTIKKIGRKMDSADYIYGTGGGCTTTMFRCGEYCLCIYNEMFSFFDSPSKEYSTFFDFGISLYTKGFDDGEDYEELMSCQSELNTLYPDEMDYLINALNMFSDFVLSIDDKLSEECFECTGQYYQNDFCGDDCKYK